MDVCKISNPLYQYTAVDDCTRYCVLGLASDKTAASTLAFLDRVIDGMPFPIQRIQTDRGAEFFAYEVQERLMRERIRFRPIRPRSPHLNGKVERSQRTDLEEFWPTVDFSRSDVEGQLAAWIRFYNHERPHDSLQGQTPAERLMELRPRIPSADAVAASYHSDKEDFRTGHYLFDQAIREMKASR
jgi:transposase InsO family protein